MKKQLLLLSAFAAMLLTLNSCGGAANSTKKETTEVSQDTEVKESYEQQDVSEPELEPEPEPTAQWDEVLDEYEEFVDQYVKFFKKAQAGDMSALTEYMECLESAVSLQEKLEDAESDLSMAQVKRLNKIILKIANAAI